MSLRKSALLLLFLPCWADAFFPPANKSTPREVLVYREQKKTEYSKKRSDYEQKVMSSRTHVEGEMNRLPWTSGSSVHSPVSASKEDILKIKNQRGGQAVLLFVTLIPLVIIVLIPVRRRFVKGV